MLGLILITASAIFSKTVRGYFADQGGHGSLKAFCGAVVAVIAGIAKVSGCNNVISKYEYHPVSDPVLNICFPIGMPVGGGSFGALLTLIWLFPVTGALLSILAGQVLRNSTARTWTQRPLVGILVDVMVGIICGLIAAMLFLPLGGD